MDNARITAWRNRVQNTLMKKIDDGFGRYDYHNFYYVKYRNGIQFFLSVDDVNLEPSGPFSLIDDLFSASPEKNPTKIPCNVRYFVPSICSNYKHYEHKDTLGLIIIAAAENDKSDNLAEFDDPDLNINIHVRSPSIANISNWLFGMTPPNITLKTKLEEISALFNEYNVRNDATSGLIGYTGYESFDKFRRGIIEGIDKFIEDGVFRSQLYAILDATLKNDLNFECHIGGEFVGKSVMSTYIEAVVPYLIWKNHSSNAIQKSLQLAKTNSIICGVYYPKSPSYKLIDCVLVTKSRNYQDTEPGLIKLSIKYNQGQAASANHLFSYLHTHCPQNPKSLIQKFTKLYYNRKSNDNSIIPVLIFLCLQNKVEQKKINNFISDYKKILQLATLKARNDGFNTKLNEDSDFHQIVLKILHKKNLPKDLETNFATEAAKQVAIILNRPLRTRLADVLLLQSVFNKFNYYQAHLIMGKIGKGSDTLSFKLKIFKMSPFTRGTDDKFAFSALKQKCGLTYNNFPIHFERH